MAEKIKIELTNGLSCKTYSAPRSWNDMGKKELLMWANILQMELTRDEAMNLAVMKLYGIDEDVFANLQAGVLYALRESLNYLEKNTLTSNVIGCCYALLNRYYGPESKLANISIAEYRRTEIYYQLYQHTKRKNFLCLLVATLWRPKGGKNRDDVRESMDEVSIIKRAKDFERWMHPAYLHSIKLFYEGCRSYIIEKHPEVYPISDAEDGPLTKPQSRRLMDLEDHILAYSGGKLGNYEETAKSNLYLFLKHMSQKIEEMNRTNNG